MRDDHVTLVAGAEYVAGARSDEWDRFLARIQPSQEVREWLARLVGYSLMGSNPARRFIVGMGGTTTGKGTFIGAINAMMGDYASATNLTIFRDNQDERPRADLADAITKRVVFMNEASHHWKLHPDQVKRMTGADEISARRPFAKGSVVRMPAFTPWLLTNGAPNIEGADSALRRRLVIVPFAETLTADEVDVELAERLTAPDARAVILQWALDGYDQLRTMGYEAGLAAPLDAMAVREEFTSSMSEFDRFLAKVCDKGDYHESPTKLGEAWEQWQDSAKISNRDRMTPHKFALALNANDFPMKLVYIDKVRTRVRYGIRLVKGWENLVEQPF
jgi:putative DNA primase/helicase